MAAIANLFNKIALNQPAGYERKKNYKFGRTLGAGTYGLVREAYDIKHKDQVAVKIIPKKNVKGHEDMVFDEMELLKSLHHPNIVEFRDWFESHTKFYIITQLARGGELFDRICEQGRFTESDAVQVVREILEAVAYLHSQHIVHRDLKPENLLYLTEDPYSPLVLADFGIAKLLDESHNQVLTSMAGSFGYAAPEILSRKGHSYPCDLWSLGVITYTLLCGYSPFRTEDRDELIKETIAANIVFHDRYWKDVSSDAKDFIKSLLNPNPSQRPSAAEALKHRWLTGETANDQTDLLPSVRAGLSARRKFKRAIEAVRLQNKIKALAAADMSDSEEERSGGRSGRSSAAVSRETSPERYVRPPAGRPKSERGSVFAEVVKAKLRDAKDEQEERARSGVLAGTRSPGGSVHLSPESARTPNGRSR